MVKSETASIKFEELDLEIPSETQRGVLTTIEGFMERTIEGLSQDQDRRKVMSKQISFIIWSLSLPSSSFLVDTISMLVF